jgi:PAS domain S-box-containing protein
MIQRLRLLQVQDSENDAALIERILTKSGHTVYSQRVVSASEMREALATGPWDLIIADYRLPDFGAPSALSVLHECGRDIPFIVVSGAMGEEVAVAMMRAGAQDYLLKHDLARLGPAVDRELRDAQTRREREQAERALRESEERAALQRAALERQAALLAQRETLLREIHHRVKNNMQVMSSLLGLQSRTASHPGVSRMLAENQNRIQSMALLHETLYQSEDLGLVDFSKYIRRMVEHLFRSYGVDPRRITLHAELDAVALELDDALPCALLISEVISNSLKHAFPDNRDGEIRIVLRGQPGTGVSLSMADNGVGLPGISIGPPPARSVSGWCARGPSSCTPASTLVAMAVPRCGSPSLENGRMRSPRPGLGPSARADMTGPVTIATAEARPPSGLRHASGLQHYALVALSVLLTVAVQFSVNAGRPLAIPLLVSLLAVVLTAYFAGRKAALMATAANLLVNLYFFAEPRFSFWVASPADRWSLAGFTAAGIGASLLAKRLSRTRQFSRVVLLVTASLLLVIVAALVWVDVESSRAAENWVEHTYQVLNASAALQATIQDAEGQQRNFLLTGDAAYLSRYRHGTAAERAALENLRLLTADNAHQRQRLAEVERMTAARFARLERGISLRRDRGIQAVMEAVDPEEGVRLKDNLAATLAAVEAEEHRLLIERTKTAARQATHTRTALAGGTAVLVALLVFAGFVIESDIGKLRASAKTLRRQADLLEKAHEPIFTWKHGGAIDYWNGGAEELYGFKAAEAVGRRSHELLQTRHPLGMATIEELLARDGRWRGELAHVAGNREIVVESLMTLVTESDGAKTVLEVNRDITETKRAHEAIRRLNQELEQRVKDRTAQLEASNKELEAFAYSVSHDLRAPLRGIDGWSLALSEDYGHLLDVTARQYLDRVRTETQRMGRLIDDLLQLSRLTRAPLERESVDLSALARAIARRLGEAEPGRRIEFVIEEGLAGAGDGHLLEIVLTNLLSNAVKFTGSRKLARIEFGRMNGDPNGDRKNAFFVRDNGVGFDMAHAGMLFGAFQRMHRRSEFPGNGIGLATAQRVVRRHGGTIWADAAPDRGATFYFTIPAGLSR